MADVFEPTLLPEDMRIDLCREVLSEGGADRINTNTATREMWVRCVMPWHDDRNPSASLSYEKLTYKCFSCGSGGGLIWLIRVIRDGSYADAKRWVSDLSGVEGGEYDLASMLHLLEALYAEPDKARTPVPTFSPRALEPWAFIHPWLTDPVEEFGRGIPEENVVRMQVGYAEEYPMGLDVHGDLRPPSERIVVPHFWRGKLVGWQSRRLVNDGTPKWLSTPDMPKDTSLYGPPETMALDEVLVVESPMTVLRHVHHLPILATFGADVTDYQVRLLSEFEKVTVWMDNDDAGWRSTLGYVDDTGTDHPGLIDRLARRTNVWAVDSDWSVDGADMDDQTAADLYAGAVPAVLWEQPSALCCWECKEYHTGDCGEEE